MTLNYRDDFGSLINALRLQVGVELGVASGVFTDRLLDTSALRTLTGVDKWNDSRHPATEKEAAEKRLQRHGARAHLVHGTFDAALSLFVDGSLDFIYIDGYAHTGQEDGRTLLEWWPKLRPGGIMAGHDYHAKWPLTVSAVNRFVSLVNLPMFLTSADQYPSWYVFKPGNVKLVEGESLMPTKEGCPVAPGRSCILVGNGASLKTGGMGKRIDEFDEVVRFNDFVLRGFEEHTGTKTTLYSCHTRNRLPTEPGMRPKRVIYRYGETGNPPYPPEELWRIPMAFYNALRQKIREQSQRPPAEKVPLLPSTGLVVALWLIEQGVPELTLTGFDHFSTENSKLHHYWSDREFGSTQDHDGQVEARMFQELESAGKVRYLV